MTAITIRVREDEDRQVIERAKDATRERTAAKALMQAARLYPDTLDELRRTRVQLAGVHSELVRLQSVIGDWQRARELERTSRRRLEDIHARAGQADL